MADEVKITVDTSRAQVKLDRVTPRVRDQLRSVIPTIIRTLAANIMSKLAGELKTHNSLSVAQEMHETTNQLYGAARLESSHPDPVGKLLPGWLEYGTTEHFVAPVRARALHWVENGEDFFSKGHWVKGMGPYRFIGRAFDENQAEIVAQIRAAVKLGASQAS